MRDSLLLAVLLSIPSMFLFWNMAPIFLIFGQKPSLVVAATPYLHALVFGLLPTFIVVALSELLLGIGHAKQVMLSTILSVAMTLLFSFTLIFGIGGAPQLGIAGAGWGWLGHHTERLDNDVCANYFFCFQSSLSRLFS